MPTMKRPASNAAAPKAKIAKSHKVIDPIRKQCAVVAKGLHGVGLPKDVAQMLDDMLFTALMPVKDERDKYQSSVVNMCEEVFTNAETELATTLTERVAAVDACNAAAAGKEAAMQEAEAALQAKEDTMEEGKRALAQAAQVFRAARSAVETAQAELDSFMQAVVVAEKDKERLQVASSECLKPLSDGVSDMDEVKRLIDSLTKVLTDFGVEQSMTLAVPNALNKPIAERGAFDTMVISQVAQELSSKAAGLQQTINEAEPGKAAKQQALQAAKDALEKAKEGQLAAAEDFKRMRAAYEESAAAFGDATKVVRAIAPERRKLAGQVAACEKRLAALREGPMKAFLELRDRVPEPETEEPPAVAEAGSPAAADEEKPSPVAGDDAGAMAVEA